MYDQNIDLTNGTVQVNEFLLTQTGTYQEQQLRPYTVKTNTESVNKLAEATRDGTQISSSALSAVAGDIVNYAAQPEAAAGIINGWTSRRFRFMMTVVERPPFAQSSEGITRIYYGYTDACDVSYGNRLDPKMRIYFNSESTFQTCMVQTPAGLRPMVKCLSTNQIISPGGETTNNNLYYPGTDTSRYLVRPADIFEVGSANNTIQMLQKSPEYAGGFDLSYIGSMAVSHGKAYEYASRKDTAPSKYLYNVLASLVDGKKEAESNQGGTTNLDHVYSEARALALRQTGDVFQNQFFNLLRDRCGLMEKGYITLEELNRVFPYTHDQGNVTNYSLDNGRAMRKLNNAQDSNVFTGWSPITQAASLIGQIVPSLMMDGFIRVIGFSATNGLMGTDYGISIDPNATRSVVDGLNMTPYLQEFQRRLGMEVLDQISRRNQIPFSVTVFADLVNDTVVEITINGEQSRYVVPTFTDSLFTPMMTTNMDYSQKLGGDLLYLADQNSTIQPSPYDTQVVAVPNQVHMQTSYNQQIVQPNHNQGNTNDFNTGLL